MGVAENLARVQERIRAACSRAGRDRDTVQLVAVSKGQPIEAVLLAFAAGQTVFGENYAQELHEKADALPEAEWHFIGALQTNKVKIVVGHAALVHTCDRVSLAQELAKRAEMKNILREIQTGRFAREWILENQAGRPAFEKLRAEGKAHPIEEVGKKIRELMSWLRDAKKEAGEAGRKPRPAAQA